MSLLQQMIEKAYIPAFAGKLTDLMHFQSNKLFSRSAKLPNGLYILPSVISYFFYYEQSYLSIYWTDFHDLFTKWKVFA